MQYLVFDSNVSQRWRRVKDFIENCTDANFWVDIKKHTRSLLKDTMEICMDWEMIQHIGNEWYKRTSPRADSRNGYYYRNLDTELGPIDELTVPRSRLGLFKTKVFQRYQRRQSAVNEAICNVFLAGVSTRDVSGAIKPLLETTFSASCVSRITKSLDVKVREFHKKVLLDEYQFLFLDGIGNYIRKILRPDWPLDCLKANCPLGHQAKYILCLIGNILLDGITLSVKGSLRAVKKLVLAAYGITVFGKKELISFRIANSESEASWIAFLNDLLTRGLKGENLKLVITDGCKGLHAALDIVYAYTKRQHCWVRKLRNVARYLKKSDEKEVLNEAKEIYKADTKREAVNLFRLWKKHWHRKYPKAVNCIEKDLDTLLAFLEISIPEKYKSLIRKKIRTTNVIERAFREVRGRTRPMSCFTNQDSVNRIIYAIFNRLNNKWEVKPLREFTQFN